MRSFVSIWCLMLALVVSGAAGAVCAPGSRVDSAAEGPLMAGNSAQSWIVSNRFQITRATSNCEQVFNVYNPINPDHTTPDSVRSAIANDPEKRRLILGHMIPHRTLPAGGAGGSGVADANILAGIPAISSLKEKHEESSPGSTIDTRDLMELQNSWPESRRTQQGQLDKRWRHGDMKDVAFLYTWPAYEAMVSTSNLNKEPEP